MPATDPKAILEIDDVKRAMRVARARGSLEGALFAWMYEFGARAAEPGLQALRDADVRAGRARPIHLKDGAPTDWFALLPFCREALPTWLEARPKFVLVPEQKTVLFPSRSPGRCYACQGEGKRPILRRDKNGRRHEEGTVECYCGGTGKRFGISRVEVYDTISDILKSAGLPAGRRHPHALRHSIISHLLEAGVPAATVQARVGHKALATTLGYAHGTRAAAAEIEGRMSDLYGGKR